jgi:thermostable 8-oxoguanine DNA glycosylase
MAKKITGTQEVEIVQLDFLGGFTNKSDKEQKQLDLFEETEKQRTLPRYDQVEEFFTGLKAEVIDRYQEYWDSIKPKDPSETFRRYLFAFMSIHSTWKSNVIGYNALKDWWEWHGNPDELKNRLAAANVGLHNNRAKFIGRFTEDFWTNGDEYDRAEDESWTAFRNRLMKRILGLGPAKTSFSLEMCHPIEANVTCMDTHLFQVYGLDQAKDLKHYERIETHWLDMSRMWNVPPYMARCIFWDKKQGKEDSRYWSYVLES